MTLQQRIKASAQELIRLLEESEKEHQDFIKERDARLGIGDPWEPDGHLILPDPSEGRPLEKSYYITSLCKLFDKVSYPDILIILETFLPIVRDGSFYFNK